jgi:hypothetical protein
MLEKKQKNRKEDVIYNKSVYPLNTQVQMCLFMVKTMYNGKLERTTRLVITS